MPGIGEDGGGCPWERDRRTTRLCSVCGRERLSTGKSNWTPKWSWRPRTWLSSFVVVLSVANVVLAEEGADGTHYTPQWAVHIEGGPEVADKIAAKHGFINLGKIFEDFYHFEHKRLQKRSLTPHSEYHSNLLNETQVKWAEQQVVKRRSKRDLIPYKSRNKSSRVRFNDVEWPHMWYLNREQGLDMNVQGAWQEGISGKGVVVTILDDGLEKTHPDLVGNYDPQASYDVNNHDQDPMPRYDSIDSNRHGTRCAGEVAAVANNSLCSVGVAFGANVGGVRMLDGDVTDAVEARSLSLNPQHIDIYSASWGPDDDGKTVDGPGELATRAFVEGVTKGRQGKGSIFVWASGNGGREHDNCNCDGYTNSIWTLSISSATENGLVPWYSEACSSTLATTYSSGSLMERQIVTTDLRHKCTDGHTGTSASAPLAAGICALALEANRDLTWRDMQHIVVRTARPGNLKSSDWKVNGVGRNVSHSFGYGLMDASAMVRLARTWKTVPEQHRCEVSAPHADKVIPPRSKVILNLNVTECTGVNFLEHVQAKISLSSSRRGDLQIYLTSPAGTRSTLLARRPQDSSKNPFNAWPFMSVHTWGEMPFGIWELEIHNEGRYMGRANLQEWSLLFYGTSQIPSGMANEKLGPFASKPTPNKSNAIHVSPKSNKNSFNSSPNYSNRKNLKNWKTKSTGSRKVTGTKAPPTTPPKGGKTTPRLWHKMKEAALPSSGGRGSPRSTSAPSSAHGLPLTIVLGPSGNFTGYQKVPDVFQKYPKVQQLFPLYVNTGKIYNDENFLLPKVEYSASKGTDYLAKGGSYLSIQKTERQNRFDTSSLGAAEGNAPKKVPPSRNQGKGPATDVGTLGVHFEDWKMTFYGTEEPPNGDALKGNVNSNPGRGKIGVKANVEEDDVPNHLYSEGLANRGGGWKDQATRWDDVTTRTTADPVRGPFSSSGCVSFSSSTSQCLECVTGLYLYGGRCEAICPPKTYQGINAKERSACMPCHYSCLTCAGESEGECTSCHDEAVPVPSGMKAARKEPSRKAGFAEPEVKVEDLPLEDGHLSWGKRETFPRRKKAVTKKILEPYDLPRTLFFCYPERLVSQLKSTFRLSVLFALNLVLMLGITSYLVWSWWWSRRKRRKDPLDLLGFRYLKMRNGDSGRPKELFSLSSSSDEE